MSRKPIIAGNWKMNKNPQEAQAFVEAIAGKLPAPRNALFAKLEWVNIRRS